MSPNATWAVVTANIGGYDFVPRLPRPLVASADCVFVTDSRRTADAARRRGWRPVIVDDDEPGHVASRRPKARPDRFTQAARSIWVDGRFRFRDGDLLSWAERALGSELIALYPHPWNFTWSDEATDCIRQDIAAAHITRQVEAYRRTGVPEHLRLWAGGIIVRHHHDDTAAFGDEWMSEIERWSSRDQISLPVALWRCGLDPAPIEGSPYEHPLLDARRHRHRLGRRELERALRVVRAKMPARSDPTG